jgi:hypothetical protein
MLCSRALFPTTPHPQVTELLLQYGADPTEPNPRGGTALDMGANQGSWRECHVLLRDFPDLPQRLGKPIVEMDVDYTPSEGWGWGGQEGRMIWCVVHSSRHSAAHL